MSSFLSWGCRGGIVASVRSSLPIRGGRPKMKKKKVGPKKPTKKSRKEEKRKEFVQLLAQRQTIMDDAKPYREFVEPDILQESKKKLAVKLTEEEIYSRKLLDREYARYCAKTNAARFHQLREMIESREKALSELRSISELLFRAAIRVDTTFLPLYKKALPETPPIPGYQPPEYVVEKTK